MLTETQALWLVWACVLVEAAIWAYPIITLVRIKRNGRER